MVFMAPSEAVGLATQIIRGRCFSLFAGFLIMSAAGATYIFGIYSKDLKSSLGYDQQTLNTLSFFKDVGANVGILSGLLNEITPPWVVLSIGAAMNLSGYLMVYFAITGRIHRPAVWHMCAYIFIGSNSQAFANTGALVTCVKNFPASRGMVLGLLKGFVGLSGAIITQLYHAIYYNDSKSLVLLIAWLPAAVSIVLVRTIRIIPPAPWRSGDSKPFFCFLYISIALAIYLLVAIIVQNQVVFPQTAYGASAGVVLFLVFLPIGVVVKEELRIRGEVKKTPSLPLQQQSCSDTNCRQQLCSDTNCSIKNSQLVNDDINGCNIKKPEPLSITTQSTTQATSNSKSCFATAFSPPARGEDYTILQTLFSLDMLILFFATICGVGGTLTAIDNMGQIGESLGYPARSISTFVSLISIWNYAGRVTAGFASEVLLKRYKFPRPLMFAIVLILSCVGHLLIAFGVPGSLYFSSVIIGFCFGAQWPLLYAIISEVFGLKYYSTLYNFGAVASPIGSYILNVKVAGRLYDIEATKQRNSGSGSGEHECIGVQCFRMSFLIITAATVAGALVSLVLVWRTRDFYRGDIYAKFKEAPTGSESASVQQGKEVGEVKSSPLENK